MATGVRHRGAVEIELADGTLVRCDGGPRGDDDADLTVLSHAHGDHLPSRPPDRLVCSPLARALAGRGYDASPLRRNQSRLDALG